MIGCEGCSLACNGVPAHRVRLGVGRYDAPLVVVSEAPYAWELSGGTSFGGRSGKLLRDTLDVAEIPWDDVYATHALLCPVDQKKQAKAKDLAACRDRLLAELDQCADKRVILCLGKDAAETVRGSKVSIAAFNGRSEWRADYGAYIVYAFHPSNIVVRPQAYNDFRWALVRAREVLDEPPGVERPVVFPYRVAETTDECVDVLHGYASKTRIVCDLETTGLDARSDAILEVGLRADGEEPFIIPADLLCLPVTDALRAIAEDQRIVWVGHNFRFDVGFLRERYGIRANVGADTMLLHYCLDERSSTDGVHHDLKTLARKLLDAPPWEDEVASYKAMADVPVLVRRKYLAYDLEYTWLLYEKLLRAAARETRDRPSREGYPTPLEVHDRLLMPAANALVGMERRGVAIDQAKLAALTTQYERELARQVNDLSALASRYVDAKKPFNPNSPVQVRNVIHAMGYPLVESTSEDALQDLQDGRAEPDPFLTAIIEHRSTKHTKTTYLDGITRRLGTDGRLRSQFLLHGTTSGRLASRNPNLQNLPRDSVVRELLVASPGRVICEADYSQLEVRVLYWYSRDANLLRSLQAVDFHWEVCRATLPAIVAELDAAVGGPENERLGRLTACAAKNRLFQAIAQRQLSAERTTDPFELYGWLRAELRHQAKVVTFGVMYGEGALSLSDKRTGIDVTVDEAVGFLRQWRATYRQADAWLRRQAALARITRWVESSSGRRRRFDYPSEYDTRIASEAMNHPVQATASDINTLAMTRLNALLPERGYGDVLLAVHDSLLCELDERHVNEGVQTIRDVMTTVVPDDDIVFDVKIKTGPSWGECK